MQTIKITTANKGEFHWESYLMQKQQSRLSKYLDKLEIDPWTKRDVLRLFKHKCNRDNIIPLSQHPINIFLNALLDDQLSDLTGHTSIINNANLKSAHIRNNLHHFINFKSQYLHQADYQYLVTDFYLMQHGNRPLNITL